MKKVQAENRKRLHLTALILGAYAVFLGFGLVLAGLEGGAAGPIRLLLGLGMMGFGLFGVWDGLRDKLRPQKKTVLKPPTQYVLTDGSGNRTSNVTAEKIREELGKDGDGLHLQLLTPLDVPEQGGLRQISCITKPSPALLAFFQTAEGGWLLRTRAMEPQAMAEWLGRLLAESLEPSAWSDGWEALEEIPNDPQETEDPEYKAPEDREFRTRVLRDWAGNLTAWHQKLTIVGEAWRNEHRFFTGRDVELAAQGVCEGKYQYAALEWGSALFDLLPDQEEPLQVIWCTNTRDEKVRRYFRRAGTAAQVTDWLLQYLNEGYLDEDWEELTDHAELQRRIYQ